MPKTTYKVIDLKLYRDADDNRMEVKLQTNDKSEFLKYLDEHNSYNKGVKVKLCNTFGNEEIWLIRPNQLPVKSKIIEIDSWVEERMEVE